ncbi:hypothetical protein E2320_013126 [Naja naja]|nr:hypothetical protein E2320_013126 [Naja naja]
MLTMLMIHNQSTWIQSRTFQSFKALWVSGPRNQPGTPTSYSTEAGDPDCRDDASPQRGILPKLCSSSPEI